MGCGVQMYMGRKVVEIEGDGERAQRVVLDDGRKIECEMVICAAGVMPATRFLQGSGVEMDQMGGLVCDPFLQTSNLDIYAAGDAC